MGGVWSVDSSESFLSSCVLCVLCCAVVRFGCRVCVGVFKCCLLACLLACLLPCLFVRSLVRSLLSLSWFLFAAREVVFLKTRSRREEQQSMAKSGMYVCCYETSMLYSSTNSTARSFESHVLRARGVVGVEVG